MPPTTQYGLLQELTQRFGTTVQSAEFTRPANTTAYAVGDVVSNSATTTTLMAFPMARANGGTGYITKARIETNQAANVAAFRLWLFARTNATLPSAVAADNAPFLISWANRVYRIGFIDFAALTTETGSDSAFNVVSDARLAFHTEANDTNIYGMLQTRTIFTPASGQAFFVALAAEQN